MCWISIALGSLEAFFTVNEQAELFLMSAGMGILFGVLYDVFRTLRVVFPPLGKVIPTAVCDAVFVTICGFGIYLFSLLFARGEVRAYFALGAALGMTVYLFTVGTVVIGIIRVVFGTVYKILLKVYNIIKIPIVKIKSVIITKHDL